MSEYINKFEELDVRFKVEKHLPVGSFDCGHATLPSSWWNTLPTLLISNPRLGALEMGLEMGVEKYS